MTTVKARSIPLKPEKTISILKVPVPVLGSVGDAATACIYQWPANGERNEGDTRQGQIFVAIP